MRQVDDYIVITRTVTQESRNAKAEFQSAVKKHLNEGYELYGQLIVVVDKSNYAMYSQVVIRYCKE